jgi:hypothetical protein
MRKVSKSRPKPIQKIIAGKEPSKSGGKKPFSWDPFYKDNNKTSSTTTSHLGSNKQGDGVINFDVTFAKPYGDVIDRQKFYFLGQASPEGNGATCTYCYQPIVFGEPGVTIYEEQDVVLCKTCGGMEQKTDMVSARIVVPTNRFLEINSQLKKAA